MFDSHLYVFSEEMSTQVFFPFFNWVVFLVLSCMSCLYVLEINPLSVVSFAIIFSHSRWCLFTMFIVSIVGQKLLSLIKSHLFLFVFIISFIILFLLMAEQYATVYKYHLFFIRFSVDGHLSCSHALRMGENICKIFAKIFAKKL